jgi:hypothetical protein
MNAAWPRSNEKGVPMGTPLLTDALALAAARVSSAAYAA